MFYATLAIIALATGALTGLTGASGMSVLISGLMLLRIDIRQIIALTFLVTLANSAASAVPYWRRGYVDTRTALVVSLFAGLGVCVGFAMGRSLSTGTLESMMIAALLFAGIKLLTGKSPQEHDESSSRPRAWGWLAGFGLFAGVVMGVMGGGGGVFIAIVLMLAFSMPAKQAVGTSIVVMAAAATPGLLLHMRAESLPWDLAAVILPISMVAAFSFARIGRNVPDRRLKQALGGLLLAMIAALIIRRLV